MSDLRERVALLPCPFCGGDAAFERLGNPRQSCIVSCNNCGCRLEANENWSFGMAWNTRADAALAEIGGVRVSPLVWTAKGYAQTPFGKYLVVREDWSGQEDFWFVCFAGKPYGKCGEHSSEEAAKAAAQADYEARILATIEPASVSVREAAFAEAADCVEKIVWIEGTGSARDRDVFTRAIEMAAERLRAIAEGKE